MSKLRQLVASDWLNASVKPDRVDIPIRPGTTLSCVYCDQRGYGCFVPGQTKVWIGMHLFSNDMRRLAGGDPPRELPYF